MRQTNRRRRTPPAALFVAAGTSTNGAAVVLKPRRKLGLPTRALGCPAAARRTLGTATARRSIAAAISEGHLSVQRRKKDASPKFVGIPNFVGTAAAHGHSMFCTYFLQPRSLQIGPDRRHYFSTAPTSVVVIMHVCCNTCTLYLMSKGVYKLKLVYTLTLAQSTQVHVYSY